MPPSKKRRGAETAKIRRGRHFSPRYSAFLRVSAFLRIFTRISQIGPWTNCYWILTFSNVAVLLSALLWAVTAKPTFALALIVTLVVANCVQVAPSAE
jgi:hypothetical protein